MVPKTKALARYGFPEQLSSTPPFKQTLAVLKKWCVHRPDLEYLPTLHSAATTMEATVDSELARIYRRGKLIKTHPRSWPRALSSPSNTTQFSNPSDIGPSTYSVDVHGVDIQLGSLPSPQVRLHGSW